MSRRPPWGTPQRENRLFVLRAKPVKKGERPVVDSHGREARAGARPSRSTAMGDRILIFYGSYRSDGRAFASPSGWSAPSGRRGPSRN